MLYRPDKQFHFVLTEATLRYRLCPPEVMLGQLDRLVTFAALPNVRLGIIGFETAYMVAPAHGFWLLPGPGPAGWPCLPSTTRSARAE
jgi:hypothetical protein